MNSSEQVIPNESLGDLSQRLPLRGEKPRRIKIILVILLVLGVIILNYWLMHQHKENISSPLEETYDIHANPISKTVETFSPISKKPEPDDQALLQQKLKAAQAQDFIDRLQAPQSLGNSSEASTLVRSGGGRQEASAGNHSPVAASVTQDPNTAFLLQASNSKASREYATHFGPLQYVVGQGKFIFGTLAVAINSDLAGPIEAVVSEDIYGEQGNKILIPKGSHLIGEYRAALLNNQSRLFTVWTRIKEPNGVDIQLGSEGGDTLGRAGLTGSVDYHFFARFGGALLTSMIGAGAATIGVNSHDQYNSSSAYRSGIADAMAEQGKNMLSENIAIPPTIKLAQGGRIVVMVQRDLDFSGVSHE